MDKKLYEFFHRGEQKKYYVHAHSKKQARMYLVRKVKSYSPRLKNTDAIKEAK